MIKAATYRKVANKLHTRNRDLSRHPRCQPMDRSYGNNGSVSSLGVRYADSNGDAYLDKITKTRRPQSLHRGSSYGKSVVTVGTYSKKVADSASPQTTREFRNAQEGVSYTPALLNTFADLSLSDGKFGEYVDSFYDVPAAGVTLTNGAGHTFKIVPASSVTTSALTFSITLDTAVTSQIRVLWGKIDGSLDETIYATDFIGALKSRFITSAFCAPSDSRSITVIAIALAAVSTANL